MLTYITLKPLLELFQQTLVQLFISDGKLYSLCFCDNLSFLFSAQAWCFVVIATQNLLSSNIRVLMLLFFISLIEIKQRRCQGLL